MEKYFVIWSDYDGRRIDEYQHQEDAEQACTSILARKDANEKDTILNGVIKGRIVEVKTIKVTSKVRLSI